MAYATSGNSIVEKINLLYHYSKEVNVDLKVFNDKIYKSIGD